MLLTQISVDFLRIVSEKADSGTSSQDSLLLDLDTVPEFVKPPLRPLYANRFIPENVSLPYIQAVLSLTPENE